jgi:hypothetical protein
MRRDQLKAELRDVEHDLEHLSLQIEELRKVAETLGMDLELVSATDKPAAQGEVTIKQAIRLVLDSVKSGLTSTDLLDYVKLMYLGDKLDRTSFSPQLSRMKRDGEVQLHGNIWTLTSHGRKMGETASRGQTNFRWVLDENEHSDANPSAISAKQPAFSTRMLPKPEEDEVTP